MMRDREEVSHQSHKLETVVRVHLPQGIVAYMVVRRGREHADLIDTETSDRAYPYCFLVNTGG